MVLIAEHLRLYKRKSTMEDVLSLSLHPKPFNPAASRVCQAPFSNPKAQIKGCFRDANAERMRNPLAGGRAKRKGLKRNLRSAAK
jgi:hypothetical protein